MSVHVVPWSPPEGWGGPLRRRRRRQVGYVAADVLAFAGFLVAGLVWDKGLLAFLWAGSAVVRAVVDAKPFWHTGARVDWEDTSREEIRIEHALRHHADVGAEFRETVTDRAGRTLSWSMLGVPAWLLVAVCAAAFAALHGDPAVRLVAASVALVAVLALVRSQRRGRRARRWLDDPLPRS